MKMSPTLIQPFLSGMFSDLEDLFQGEDLLSISALENLQASKRWILSRPFPEFILPLANLGKAMEIALSANSKLAVPLQFPLHPGSFLPDFCYYLWSAVFHEDGTPRYHYEDFRIVDVENDRVHEHQAQISAMEVYALRQLCLAFSKVKDKEPEALEADEIQAFRTRVTTPVEVKLDRNVTQVARHLLTLFFYDEEGRLQPSLAQWIEDPWGRHGPGTVADGSQGSEKWEFNSNLCISNKHYWYPYGEVAYGSGLDREHPALPSKVTLVPKDFRGRRIICIEPKELMFFQQGLMHTLYDLIDSHWLTRRSISLKDQAKSFRMSRNLHFSTIDLKDASDRVSLTIGRLLLPKEIFALLTRYRSQSLELPNGEIVEQYTTLFTMGNALCFPIETLIFWAISLATLIIEDQRDFLGSLGVRWWEKTLTFSLADIQRKIARRDLHIRVFGDDVIVPARFFEEVCASFRACGFVPNTAKCCHRGLVREACGSWYYSGMDTVVIRFKYHKVGSELEWASLLTQCRLLYEGGFTQASLALLGELERVHEVPYGRMGLPGHPRISSCYRWNKDLQRLEFRMPVLVYERGARGLNGVVGVYAYFTDQATEAFSPGEPQRFKWEWRDVSRT